ncbi:uncharacterized protein LOC117650885 [Thrips palmi]|uniref:Uncharacterized protein LOC117650885 n=1 Tax=Thrips palmi TaxID=161013 RepID=A0A6P8ZYC2_THRPL|nr:uncharacterized protein LOC117650885 [Thrips palmi]
MDKKKLKRSKQESEPTNSVNNTPKESNEMCDILDDRSSPDFLSSQECFSVGWDWSSHISGNKKPTIRFVERPAPKKSKGVQLLECSRPRRLIRNRKADNFDDSVFVKELKSLAAGCKGIPETTSPVASPPSFRRKMEVLVTPTSFRESMRRTTCSKSVESSASATTTPSSSKDNSEEEVKDSLDDLLDDSLGADLLKFTQDIEQSLKQNDFKTPKPQDKGFNLSSGKRRNRLSLSSKKSTTPLPKSVCRRINDLYEENLTSVAPRHEPQAINNNNKVSSKIEFDDIDEAVMLSIGKLEEKEVAKSADKVSKENARTFTEVADDKGEDDDFVSPDLLDLIDVWEKEATQERERTIRELKETKSHSAKEQPLVNKFSNKMFPKKQEKAIGASNQQVPKKTLSLCKTSTICTPEEIERKRQDAKKRLQLKKKC